VYFSKAEVKVALSWTLKLWMKCTEVGRIRHEVAVTKFNALSRHLLWEYEKHHERIVTWVGVPTGVQRGRFRLQIWRAAAKDAWNSLSVPPPSWIGVYI